MTIKAPATVGMAIEDVDTPCLLIDLDSFERNVEIMGQFTKEKGLRLRAHAKTHKSSDIAIYQIEKGGACGVCCQKVSEAEALVGGGVRDVLISNQVVAPKKIERLAALATRARMLVCVDGLGNIGDLSAAAESSGAIIECLVEIEVGGNRCGVEPGEPAVRLAKAADAASGLRFSGLQAYQGSAQHIHDFTERKAAIDAAVSVVARTVDMLQAEGLHCDIVAGAGTGTGTYYFESASGVYTELQCGSYIFMDADYQSVLDDTGKGIGEFENSLFIYTSVMSKARVGKAVCDAGLKALSVDSGPPVIFDRDDVTYLEPSDEHGLIDDPGNVLTLNEKLMLIFGHCDPTVNLYDWFVCVRNGRVEALWPVTARGMCL